MRKLELFVIGVLFLFCVMNPELVNSEQKDNRTFFVSENIYHIGDFLKQQDYFSEVSKICHDTKCFAIDVYDLNHSISVVQDKMFQYIKDTKGEDVAIEAQLKGFSITKILLR